MSKLDRRILCDFVNEKIASFHDARISRLQGLELKDVLKKKNPYLFRAKNVVTAAELVTGIMDAFLSSFEGKLFGDLGGFGHLCL